MTDQDSIQTEMRLFALETIVCQHFATLYLTMPRQIFDEVQKQTIEGARAQTFPGVDPAQSDLFAAEFQAALERLYGIIRANLDKT
jgi:hypothetical protein